MYLSENVIPGSLNRFNYEDKNGYTLWSIKLLKIPISSSLDPINEFIKNCKDKIKYIIRNF